MAVTTQGGVVRLVQAFLEDPAGARFSAAYVTPIIDHQNQLLQTYFEKIGIQQQEQIAIFNLPAATAGPVDLSAYMQTGQPLQYLMRPKRLDWKPQGQPDTAYLESDLVEELDDVAPGNLGCQQWRWANGSIQVTANYGGAVTLRIYFDALASSLWDQSAGIMRGIGNVLALAAAKQIAATNNGMGTLQKELQDEFAKAKRSLSSLLVMQKQSQNIFPRSTKRGAFVQISSGGVQSI
ncbi:MAG: hypothetical protein KGL39_37365 [Patescibacteria group bacterium]|nr:hypothetical protein [Patescibacteria group bacterium]